VGERAASACPASARRPSPPQPGGSPRQLDQALLRPPLAITGTPGIASLQGWIGVDVDHLQSCAGAASGGQAISQACARQHLFTADMVSGGEGTKVPARGVCMERALWRGGWGPLEAGPAASVREPERSRRG